VSCTAKMARAPPLHLEGLFTDAELEHIISGIQSECGVGPAGGTPRQRIAAWASPQRILDFKMVLHHLSDDMARRFATACVPPVNFANFVNEGTLDREGLDNALLVAARRNHPFFRRAQVFCAPLSAEARKRCFAAISAPWGSESPTVNHLVAALANDFPAAMDGLRAASACDAVFSEELVRVVKVAIRFLAASFDASDVAAADAARAALDGAHPVNSVAAILHGGTWTRLLYEV